MVRALLGRTCLPGAYASSGPATWCVPALLAYAERVGVVVHAGAFPDRRAVLLGYFGLAHHEPSFSIEFLDERLDLVARLKLHPPTAVR